MVFVGSTTNLSIIRYELIDILRNNNFNTPDMRISDVYVTNKRAKQTQRRILKGFNINTVDDTIKAAFAKNGNQTKDFFKTIAKAITSKKESKSSCFFFEENFNNIIFFS